MAEVSMKHYGSQSTYQAAERIAGLGVAQVIVMLNNPTKLVSYVCSDYSR